MPHLSLFPTILREVFASAQVERVPEPPVMTDREQVGAYVEASVNKAGDNKAALKESVMAAAYLFHAAKICQVMQGCVKVADLGCGPATQLVHIAALNPDIQFTGFDLSDEMVSQGNALIADMGLTNVRVEKGDITRLDSVTDGNFDGVISTMTLHQFPELEDVIRCFATISRILKPGGSLYIVDFGRLKSLKSMQKFVSLDAANQSPVFNEDYLNSLKAAFLEEELRQAAAEHLPSHIKIQRTFALPMLVVMKTEDRPLPRTQHKMLIAKRKEFSKRYRMELDDIRLFFKLGGMKNDPFSPQADLVS